MFWDGRATGRKRKDPLAEQAKGPFLHPLEQNIPDAATFYSKGKEPACAVRAGDGEVQGADAAERRPPPLPRCGKAGDPRPGGNCWPEPEVPKNLDTEELGNLGLTDKEEEAIVAFLGTLSDGYSGGK